MRLYVVRHHLALCVVATIFSLFIAVPTSSADETGMAGIHSWRKVGKKTCLVDHFHDGSGSGTTQKLAELAAVRSWVSFTDLEYGSDWADFRQANSRSMKCNREDVARWTCRAEAVACRGR
jgi:hypothetical protein